MVVAPRDPPCISTSFAPATPGGVQDGILVEEAKIKLGVADCTKYDNELKAPLEAALREAKFEELKKLIVEEGLKVNVLKENVRAETTCSEDTAEDTTAEETTVDDTDGPTAARPNRRAPRPPHGATAARCEKQGANARVEGPVRETTI